MLDGAHTEESMEVCKIWYSEASSKLQKQSLKKLSPIQILVFYCSASRNPQKLLSTLAQSNIFFDCVIFTTYKTNKKHILEDKRDNRSNREKDKWPEILINTWSNLKTTNNQEKIICQSVNEVIFHLENYSEKFKDRNIYVLITGSLYLVGAFLEILKPEMLDSIQK